MNHTVRVTLFLFAAFSSIACPGPTTGDGDTDGGATTGTDGGATTADEPTGTETGGENAAGCAAIIKEYTLQSEEWCRCYVAEGDYPDVATCMLDSGLPLSSETQSCMCEAWTDDPDGAAFLQCGPEREKTYTACLKDAQCDRDKAGECLDAALLTTDCPDTSVQTDAKIDLECFDASPFQCTSGEQIPDDWTCNGMKDCKDGSDEPDDCM
jgi:hypothetical protein